MIAWASAFLLGLAPHEGPDPVAEWRFEPEYLDGATIRARLGTDGQIEGGAALMPGREGHGLWMDGEDDRVVIARDSSALRAQLPQTHLTVSAWVSVNTPHPWGGIVGTIQDNGGEETGWMLGYDQRFFTFALASEGGNEREGLGDGQLTYLNGKTSYDEGRLYHVAATYDGAQMRLYVNGELDATSDTQSGPLLYPASAPLTVGAYWDDDESYFHNGFVRKVSIFDLAAEAEWVRHEYEEGKHWTELEPYFWLDPEHRMLVPPYLQYATRDGMRVMWETSRPSTSLVHYGETAELGQTAVGEGDARIHEVHLTGLLSATPYFYRVESKDSEGRVLESPVLTFQTAGDERTPFAFAVISDTQDNPEVAGRIAQLAWEQRPSFVLHPGDLVGTGSDRNDWRAEFFPSMKPLIERVAFFPVLGNHEQDARFYYDYMSLPAPEYYYSFQYGCADFFLIDSNRKVAPGSEQYAWLEQALERSNALWKFVVYHHPSYTSDENDYGDMWQGKSTHGDLRVRELCPLYDRYGVDIVWNGHIHSYERTWPILDGRVTDDGGTVYMITGGGGGSLETPGPVRPWFQNNVRQGQHHFCMVAINGRTLELKAFDESGRLFDVLTIEKR